MALSTYFQDPSFDNMERTMRMLLPGFGPTWGMSAAIPSTSAMTHAFDVQETDKAYHLITDAPGMTPDDVHVELQGDMLVVSGQKQQEKRKEEKAGGVRLHRNERAFHKFSRSFILPEDVMTDHINARMEHGVLTVEIPKMPQEKRRAEPKRIRVAGGPGMERVGITAGEPEGAPMMADKSAMGGMQAGTQDGGGMGQVATGMPGAAGAGVGTEMPAA